MNLYHGDCLEVLPSLEGGSVDLIVTDPPYGISYKSHARKVSRSYERIQGDSDLTWLKPFAGECYRLLKENTHLYSFIRYDTYCAFYEAFREAGFTMKRTLLWIKGAPSAGDLVGDYAPLEEWIIFAQKGRRALNGGRDSNVLSFRKVASTALVHPNQKPLPLLEFLIKKSSNEGEVVLDPFAGSGSTVLAALRCNRDAIGVEVSEEFFRKMEYRAKKFHPTNK